MARKTTPRTTGRSTRTTTGRGVEKAGVAAQEVPQAQQGEVVERPGTATTSQPAGPTQEQIAQRAHEIWIRHGCPFGEDRENWFEAEAELKREMGVR